MIGAGEQQPLYIWLCALLKIGGFLIKEESKTVIPLLISSLVSFSFLFPSVLASHTLFEPPLLLQL
jgi:hypothetical protein